MAASKEAILVALETSIFAFPAMPERWEVLDFPGVRAHATPQTSHPLGNLVGVATLTADNADAVIAQVRDFFAAREHTVGWSVNPSSTPGDLVSRLEAAGFAKVIELLSSTAKNGMKSLDQIVLYPLKLTALIVFNLNFIVDNQVSIPILFFYFLYMFIYFRAVFRRYVFFE